MNAARPPEPDMDDLGEAMRRRLGQRQDQPPAAPEPVAVVEDEDDGPLEEPAGPARSVGRAGRGMVNQLVYAPQGTMGELMRFADDMFFATRGRVKRWQVIDAVIRAGLRGAVKGRIVRRLAPEMADREAQQ